jgi:septal ring-binding cell division protein DamX
MKSKSLLGMVQLALVVAIGGTQLQQALPIMAKLAHQTAAPLEQVILLGATPSYPASPAPAAQPFAMAAPVQVCDRTVDALPVHVRHTVLRVEAQRPTVETIADTIPVHLIAPPRVVRVSVPVPMIDQMVQLRTNQAGFGHEMAKAQRDIQRAMRESQHHQITVVF